MNKYALGVSLIFCLTSGARPPEPTGLVLQVPPWTAILIISSGTVASSAPGSLSTSHGARAPVGPKLPVWSRTRCNDCACNVNALVNMFTSTYTINLNCLLGHAATSHWITSLRCPCPAQSELLPVEQSRRRPLVPGPHVLEQSVQGPNGPQVGLTEMKYQKKVIDSCTASSVRSVADLVMQGYLAAYAMGLSWVSMFCCWHFPHQYGTVAADGEVIN